MFGKKGMVSLLLILLFSMALPGSVGCAKEGAGVLPCQISLDDFDTVFIASYADPSLLTKESKKNIIEIGLTVANPNNDTATLDYLSPELYIDGIFWGAAELPGNVYIPAGRAVNLRFIFTPSPLSLVQSVSLGEGKTVPDAIKRVLGTLDALSKGTAKCSIKGTAGFSTKVGSHNQVFDFVWPTE